MIGIVVTAQGEDEEFPNKIYHRFGELCSLERVVKTTLKVDYVHKVAVEMPVADKTTIVGSIHRRAVINTGLTEIGRKASYLFSDGTLAQRIAHAGRELGLDTIVHIDAACTFIPTWLINEVIYFYKSNKCEILHTYHKDKDLYDKGFKISIYPYYVVARAAIYDEDLLSITEENAVYFENKDPNEIVKKDFSLYLSSRNQISVFDAIAEEVKYGSIESVLETMDV